MTWKCPGCGADCEPTETTCPACGLVQDSEMLPPPPSGPDLFGLQSPGLFDEDGVQVNAPPARTRPLGPLVLLAVALLCVPLLLRAFRKTEVPPPPEVHEPTEADAHAHVGLRTLLRRYVESERPFATASWPPAHDFDSRRVLDRFARHQQASLERERLVHTPFVRAEGEDLHAWFGRYLARLGAVDPDTALWLGSHPHPTGITGLDDATYFSQWLLRRDAYEHLRAWDTATLSGHERVDHAVLVRWFAYWLLRERDANYDRVLGLPRILDALVQLRLIECCPAEDRALVAIERLTATPAALRDAADALWNPGAPLLASTITQLHDSAAYLREFADAWEGLAESTRAALRRRALLCAQRVDVLADDLRERVLPRATGATGMGLENLTLTLGHLYVLDRGPADLCAEALDALDAACQGLAEEQDFVFEDPNPPVFEDLSTAEHVRRLQAAVDQWFIDIPTDPGLSLTPVPRAWSSLAAEAYHLRPGALAGSAPAVLLVGKRPPAEGPEERLLDEIAEIHTTAHESYPGHHLEYCGREGLCVVRSFVEDPVFIEGWARYAEGLAHEAGLCIDGRTDRATLQGEAAHYAWITVLDLLIQSGNVADGQVVAWMQAYRGEDVSMEDLGALAAFPAQLLVYHIGEREIRGLIDRTAARRGGAFDRRAFHGELIRSGGIPIRLLEPELR